MCDGGKDNLVISCENISFSYEPGRPVLSELSFCVRDGERIGLIGANGAGKTTLMKLMLGLLPLQQGRILVDDIPVSKNTLREVRQKLGFVLQNSDNQMFMPTVWEDMLFGPLNYGLSEEEAGQKADRILERLGLQNLKNRYNHRISGGEKRMAAIATVLAMEPEVILMDEPTSALDPYNRRIVIHVIRELPQTMLISSHDLDMIRDTCSRVILLYDGKIIADDETERILTDRELLETYRMELPLSGR